jgi:hypothetical protein
LFDPARHEPLIPTAWDPARARATIERIVADAWAQRNAQGLWLPHPRDLEPGEDPTLPSATLYFGAGGIVWALRRLQARGLGPAQGALPVDWDALRAQSRRWLRAVGCSDDASYLMGELPILMQAWDERGDPALLDELVRLIEANADHPARELMWGAPGSMLAALHLFRRSGDGRLADAFRRIAAVLEQRLRRSAGDGGCEYWTQSLYGRESSYLGAAHGFIGTAHGLIAGRELLCDAAWTRWHERIVRTVGRTARWEDGRVNWRNELDDGVARPIKWLLQHCHGAPGFVTGLAALADNRLDELLRAAGETIWAAGPLAKGPNLCHGTAGNGYALLKLHARFGEGLWLERARAFAMHAIVQAEGEAARHGRWRHSLWTGDEGLALYLWDCLRARAAFPTMDLFFEGGAVDRDGIIRR